MTVTALVNGFEQRKAVKVEVIDCITQDSILDNAALRKQLMAAMAKSNPDSTPESMKRREVGGVIFRNVDSLGVVRYYFKETSSYTQQTACTLSFTPSFPGNQPGDIGVAIFHTHPNSPKETVYGCPEAGAQQFPNGPGKPKKAGDASKTGGGSDADWNAADRGRYYPSYVMTKNGLISRLTPLTAKALRKSNPNMWRWKNSPTGCNWQSSS